MPKEAAGGRSIRAEAYARDTLVTACNDTIVLLTSTAATTAVTTACYSLLLRVTCGMRASMMHLIMVTVTSGYTRSHAVTRGDTRAWMMHLIMTSGYKRRHAVTRDYER